MSQQLLAHLEQCLREIAALRLRVEALEALPLWALQETKRGPGRPPKPKDAEA